ncbi:hypothetical protein C3L33_05032, partial [Rhododendron williamsianum]
MVLCIKFLVSCATSMMTRSKGQVRKSVVPLLNVKVKKAAIVHEEISPQKSQRKPSGFALYVKDMTQGLKKSFKEDNIIKQTEVMAAMSEWWHEGFWRKHYDKTYEGSSDGEENDDEEVNDEEASEQEANNCLPPPKKKKSEGESKKKKKVQPFIKTRCSPRKFIALIRSLIEDQVGAIKEINPFHTLLNVKCTHLHRAFAMQLVQCFNPDTCSIELRRGIVFPITKEDVARVLGMPIGDTPVPTECLESYRQKIKDFEGCFKGIELSRLENVIREGKTDGRFQRAYMLFALGCLLCPRTKEVARNVMRQFVDSAKSLHEMDVAMIEPVGGSPEHGSLPGMSPSISPESGQDVHVNKMFK